MRSLSDFIASTKPEGREKPAGTIAYVAFALVLLTGAAVIAYWIGASMTIKTVVSSLPAQSVSAYFGL